jgi:hypothetical protein
MNSLLCNSGLRREKVRQHTTLNGLDYLEVGQPNQLQPDLENQRYLRVYFLGKAPVELDKTNIRIEGGRRIRDIQVVSFEIHQSGNVEFDDSMEIFVDKAGDFSTYTLRVVEKDEQGQWQPHSAFDPRYDRVEFNFKVDCPNDFDCKPQDTCPAEPATEPDINYLAKDYASFRQLILDRMALIMAEWKERHIPDIGIALVEVLAYVGDHLSYYQDAVATEAYLDTARQRLSVRRHARLVDYLVHEGCNARAWLCVEVNNDLPLIKPEDIYFITRLDEVVQGTLISELDLQQFPVSQYEVFESIADEDIRLYKDHNRIKFYTWGDQQCCIPRGSTTATLTGEWIPPYVSSYVSVQDPECTPGKDAEKPASNSAKSAVLQNISSVKLHLKTGDILFFEEVIGPETGNPQDANPRHRHAVRLTAIAADIDPLNGQPVTHITWDKEDALPFPLCLSVLGPPQECRIIENVSIACGNVILVDHGKMVDEDLDDVPEGEVSECCKDEGILAESVRRAGRYNPLLKSLPLTFSETAAGNKPAAHALEQDVHNAVPAILLISHDENMGEEVRLNTGDLTFDPSALRQSQHERIKYNPMKLKPFLLSLPKQEWLKSTVLEVWLSQADLLSSQANDPHFVAELDNEGRAHLRFGNGELGRKPVAGMKFHAQYRIGNGLAGNVGAESISHVVFKNNRPDGIKSVRNPMPARGGTAWEPISEAKLFAPHAFRKELQRAVIADDYAAIVLREFKNKVQNAVAKLRWNGSWYEVWVAIDPFGREEADQALLDEIARRLHRYRRIGHDLVVKPAQRVPLDIELNICVRPNYLRGHVKAELLNIFSNKRLSDGKPGFFHPDNLTFGDDVYLSKIVAAALSVQCIESVTVRKMQRFGELENNEIENGLLPLSPFEIARLDNDPSFPENGKLTLDMRGGR